MSMQRYDRNSIDCLLMPTVNPCNNFIIDYLMRTKIKSDKQVSTRYFMYNLAIESVKKYPLPLMCQEQLAALEGFGNFFINRVAKLIKRHYQRGRYPTEAEMDEDDRQHLEGLREFGRRASQFRIDDQGDEFIPANLGPSNKPEVLTNNFTRRQVAPPRPQQSKQELNVPKQEEFVNMFAEQEDSRDQPNKTNQNSGEKQFQFEREKFDEHFSKLYNISEKSKDPANYHENGRKKRTYKPRKGTEAFQILKILVKMKANEKPVLKGDINEQMFNDRKQKMKGWIPVRNRLIETGYINLIPTNQDLVFITEKGVQWVYELEGRGFEEEKLKSQSDRSRSNSHERQKFKQQVEMLSKREGKKIRDISKISNDGIYSEKIEKLHKTPRCKKQQVVSGKTYREPVVIVNENSVTCEEDRKKMYDILGKTSEYKYKKERLAIGEFAWKVNQMLLDLLVLRVVGESLDVDQFHLTCLRLRFSECSNIYIVFENDTTQKSDPVETNLASRVLADCRSSGFKAIRTKNISQTLNFLGRMTQQINRRLKDYQLFNNTAPLFFMGTTEQFNSLVESFKPAINKNVAIRCLQRVPHITKPMLKKIVRKMPALVMIYNKLDRLKNNRERREFVEWYLKEFNPKQSIANLIVDLLFYSDYSK